ncbi:MAG: alpha/beta fold hydrolase [Deltaproteobacteria bacterium]|nr:alpha/beta fold hydrolase [Deltaproteobacteria bacterium]
MDPNTPVVFLHAFPLHAGMWADQREALGGREVLTPDFPGFGGRAPGEPTLEAFARAVLADLDAAGIDRAIFVGLSMGGYVAFRLHALAPERFAGLVLADTRSGADDEAGRQKRSEQAARVRAEGTGWMAAALLPALLGETTRRERPDAVARAEALITGADAEGVARALEAMRDRPDSTPQLGEITCPTLVLVGAEDTLTPPAAARAMVEALPDARLVELPGAGHLSNLELPEAFDAALLDFLA